MNEPRPGQKAGQVEMGGPDAYGLPPRKAPGSILRSQVGSSSSSSRCGVPYRPYRLHWRLALAGKRQVPPAEPHAPAPPPPPAPQVAECCVAALVEPAASYKVVEVIARESNPARPYTELFASV